MLRLIHQQQLKVAIGGLGRMFVVANAVVGSCQLTTPHHTTPHHTTPHYTTPHHATPHHTTPHHTTPPTLEALQVEAEGWWRHWWVCTSWCGQWTWWKKVMVTRSPEVVHGGLWWFMAVCGGFRCSCCLRWFVGVFVGLWWLLVDCGGF